MRDWRDALSIAGIALLLALAGIMLLQSCTSRAQARAAVAASPAQLLIERARDEAQAAVAREQVKTAQTAAERDQANATAIAKAAEASADEHARATAEDERVQERFANCATWLLTAVSLSAALWYYVPLAAGFFRGLTIGLVGAAGLCMVFRALTPWMGHIGQAGAAAAAVYFLRHHLHVSGALHEIAQHGKADVTACSGKVRALWQRVCARLEHHTPGFRAAATTAIHAVEAKVESKAA